MSRLHVKNYGNGGPGCYDTYRVAWDIGDRAEGVDLRSPYWLDRDNLGWSGSAIVTGANARDAAAEDARRKIDAAKRALETAWERGDIDTIASMTHRSSAGRRVMK